MPFPGGPAAGISDAKFRMQISSPKAVPFSISLSGVPSYKGNGAVAAPSASLARMHILDAAVAGSRGSV